MEPVERIERPGKIVCVGRNYAEHAEEMGNVLPQQPLLFLKPPSSFIGHGENIVLPEDSEQVEHEGEIGVVIGKQLSGISAGQALDGIAGITCVNDVTARDLQRLDSQWTRAKGFDTFCPAGPKVVPLSGARELLDLEVICRVNGDERQHGYAREMHFGIPELVAYISRIMTLEPGDLVATGTPSGVGPLKGGDLVEVEIPGVGILSNPVLEPGTRATA